MRKPDLMGKDRVNNNATKAKLRKGLWSPEEDEKLIKYMLTNGQGCWRFHIKPSNNMQQS
ncbi:r2r3-myb transcription factor, putative [Ricinus communis]|uniref:R2r3-myb transcription factor, putative n=1 Tax=Ricinus communis TaxID=3988 RepID=B9T0Y5_RICCO|nr:r2r3-myb transcription factor, putative [Ricinus communis]